MDRHLELSVNLQSRALPSTSIFLFLPDKGGSDPIITCFLGQLSDPGTNTAVIWPEQLPECTLFINNAHGATQPAGSWCCWDKPGAVVSFSGCSSQEELTQTIPELMGSGGDQDRESTWGKAQSSLGASGKF